MREGVLRNFAKFTRNTRARVSFLIKLQASTCNFIKNKTLAQVFSSKKTSFTEHFQMTASVNSDAKKMACFTQNFVVATKNKWK